VWFNFKREFKICLVTSYCLSCHFNKYQVISAIKIFSSSRLISLNRVLEFDQNILSKYSLKEASLDFKTIERQRKDMFCSRMRCDLKTKCKMAKIHNKMIDNSSPFLDQLFWQYLCLAKHF